VNGATRHIHSACDQPSASAGGFNCFSPPQKNAQVGRFERRRLAAVKEMKKTMSACESFHKGLAVD